MATGSLNSQCGQCGGTGYHTPQCPVVTKITGGTPQPNYQQQLQAAQQQLHNWQQWYQQYSGLTGQQTRGAVISDAPPVEEQDTFSDWVLWVRWSNKKKALLAATQIAVGIVMVLLFSGLLTIIWGGGWSEQAVIYGAKVFFTGLALLPLTVWAAQAARKFAYESTDRRKS